MSMIAMIWILHLGIFGNMPQLITQKIEILFISLMTMIMNIQGEVSSIRTK